MRVIIKPLNEVIRKHLDDRRTITKLWRSNKMRRIPPIGFDAQGCVVYVPIANNGQEVKDNTQEVHTGIVTDMLKFNFRLAVDYDLEVYNE